MELAQWFANCNDFMDTGSILANSSYIILLVVAYDF